MTINIMLNGEAKQVNSDYSVAQLLDELNLQNKRLAVEINQDLISRSQFSQHKFNKDDKVEIVQAIGGG